MGARTPTRVLGGAGGLEFRVYGACVLGEAGDRAAPRLLLPLLNCRMLAGAPAWCLQTFHAAVWLAAGPSHPFLMLAAFSSSHL